MTDPEAIMNATLALAFEQRTANLIAFLSWEPTGNQSDSELQMMIVKRLGLGDENA
jgi:hypothetical protein